MDSNWVILLETNDFMESESIKALLKDNQIDCFTKNKADTSSAEPGTGKMEKISKGIPILIYVDQKDVFKARLIINTDRSSMFDKDDLDFGILGEDSPEPEK